MKTMKKSNIDTAARRIDRRSNRGSMGRKSLMAVCSLAAMAAIGRMLRNRRAH
jgi:hypothetical protein